MSMKQLMSEVKACKSRDDLAKFIQHLKNDLINNPSDWENSELVSFLNALAACISDVDGYYQNRGEKFDEKPTWGIFAHVLLTAKIYE